MTASSNIATPVSCAAAHALARAWEAFHLYGPDHPATTMQLSELHGATKVLREPLRLAVEPHGLVWNRATLEPSRLFESLAEALCRAGIGLVEMRSGFSAEGSRRFFEALRGGHGAGDAEKRVHELEKWCGRALRLLPFSAAPLGGEAAVTSPTKAAAKEGVRLSDLTEQRASLAGGPIEGAPVRRGDARLEPVRDVVAAVRAGVLADTEDDRGKALRSLEASLDRLDDAQRRHLVDTLATDRSIAFSDASKLLNMMPASCVREAAGVLERPDATLNQTSLMLLRRLSRLSAEDSGQMARLGGIAERWASAAQQPGVTGEPAISSGAAELLEEISKSGEYRSESYTELLGALASAPPEQTEMLAQDFRDETENAESRAFEVCFEALGGAGVEDAQAAAMLPRLGALARSLAEKGDIEPVQRLLEAATRERGGDGALRATAAKRLLDQAEREGWLATAIGRCGNPDAVTNAIRPLIERSRADAATTLVAASGAALTERDQSAVLAAAGLFEARDLDQAVQRRLVAAPGAAGAIVPLVERAIGARAPYALMPVVCHEHPEVRRGAYVLLATVPLAWPVDLALRGLCDPEEDLRLMAIDRLDAGADEPRRALIERVSGLAGPVPVTRAEVFAIARRLTPHPGASRAFASALLRQSMRDARSEASDALAELVRGQQSSVLSGVALAARFVRSRWFRGKGARRHVA
jgi:hypothetical protein